MDEQKAKDKVVVKACRYVRNKRAKKGTQGEERERAQSRIVESERQLNEAVEKLEKKWPNAVPDDSPD